MIDSESIELHHPFTAICAGPTGSGKTVFISKLIDNLHQMINPVPERVIYCYSIWQDTFMQILKSNPQVEFVQNLIPTDEIDGKKRNFIILDDLMDESKDDVNVSNLFTKGSHHKNISVFFMSQNLFVQGKHTRTISLNSHYLVVFKNPRDRAQFSNLARQMYPNNSKYLEECYNDATKIPHGYLFIDLKQKTPDAIRIRTNIFPNEKTIVYIRKT